MIIMEYGLYIIWTGKMYSNNYTKRRGEVELFLTLHLKCYNVT